MKKTLLIILGLVLGIASPFAQISITEALEKGNISISITGNEESTHYLIPLNFTVSNESAKKIELIIPLGLVLISFDSEEQNFVTSEELLVQLAPNSKKKIDIHAMCIESHDAAPSSSSNYRLGNVVENGEMRFLQFVAQNKLFGPGAQFMLWDIVDSEIDFAETDSITVNEDGDFGFYRYTPFHEYEMVAQVEPEPVNRLIEVYGNFDITLGSTKHIHIAMFNENNVLVKELYNNPNCPSGNTKIDYTFNSAEFAEGNYQIKVVMNDRIMLKRDIELKV